jgi:DNA-binding NarL/FixJ family response regulator
MLKTTVLLADDHDLVRAGLHNALKDLPNLTIVGEVGDGRSLPTALAHHQPDCLIIDVTMPYFDPIPTIRTIRQQYPAMKVLVISAYDDDVYVQGLLGAGVHGYHLKDQPLSDLRLAVQRVLEGQRWISSPLLDKLLQPTAQAAARPTLSGRQRELLRLLVEGLDNRAIALRLDLSVKTVENHLTRLYRQLNVQSRLEAANVGRHHPELPQAQAKVAEQATITAAEKIAILLVDDNGRYRKQLRRLIGRLQPQAAIYEASHTSQAVEIADQITPNLAFIDVVLGEEDGIRCTRQIKQIAPTVNIVLISAYPDQEFHRQGLQAGATAFVDKKDLDAAALRQIMDDIIWE